MFLIRLGQCPSSHFGNSSWTAKTELRHLAEAERHVAQGEHHIVEQEARIAELDRNGNDTTHASRLLENFRAVQEQHIQHRNFILQKLSE